MDAFAAPFVQGRLQKKELSVTVRSTCAHCSDPVEMEISSDLEINFHGDGNTRPMVFVPEINVRTLEEPSIINSF